jgi:hypothetical protein
LPLRCRCQIIRPATAPQTAPAIHKNVFMPTILSSQLFLTASLDGASAQIVLRPLSGIFDT